MKINIKRMLFRFQYMYLHMSYQHLLRSFYLIKAMVIFILGSFFLMCNPERQTTDPRQFFSSNFLQLRGCFKMKPRLIFHWRLYNDQTAVFFTSQSDVCLLSLVGYFSHMETSSLAGEGSKFLHILGAHEQWFFRLPHLRPGDLIVFNI